MSDLSFDNRYPSIDELRQKAKSKIPSFVFDYLDGGCNEDINLHRNTKELREIQLTPHYLSKFSHSSMKTELFGHVYDAPFGIAPIGLQGLIWPKAPEILAKAAFKHNLPFILSTVTTMSIERASELTEGQAWFQLYHPADDTIRDNIILRAASAECQVLVLLCDVPTFGFRPRDIRNGLAMPPKMNISNILQILKRPEWALRTLLNGQPNFETLRPYMPKHLDLNQLGLFMDKTFSGRLNEEKIAPIRDIWKGSIVLKGVAGEEDTEKAINLGLDGVIISNHGGRQLDAGEATITPLKPIAKKYGKKIKIMMDSGIRSGPDIARTMASGAAFAFLGRTFMYSVAALGSKGGDHAMGLLKTQLKQIMEQLSCEDVSEFVDHLNQ